MPSCSGDGACFTDCFCGCYDPITDEDHEVCTCGHREHKKRYCREAPCVHNCEFVKCTNFDLCKTSIPQRELVPGTDMCHECWAYRGKLTKSAEPEECVVCLDKKIVVELSCHSSHKICLDCWDKTIHSQAYPSKCPLCRAAIGAWKFNPSN